MKTLDYLHLDEQRVVDVRKNLQQLLADYQVFYTNLRHMHWNIKGRGFFVLHEKFESLYDTVSEQVDEIAERILMLGGTPESRFSEYLKIARIQEVTNISTTTDSIDNILASLKYFIGNERQLLQLADEAGDDITADLLTGYLKEQEKLVWMLIAFSTK